MFTQAGVHSLSGGSTDLSLNMPQHQEKSTISHLSPQKAREHVGRYLNHAMQNAADRASSSTDDLPSMLAALAARNGETAPGSNLKLIYKGGLLGGSGRENFGGWGSDKLEKTYEKWVNRRLPYEREKTTRKDFMDRLPPSARHQDSAGSSNTQSSQSQSTDLSATHYKDADGFWVKKGHTID